MRKSQPTRGDRLVLQALANTVPMPSDHGSLISLEYVETIARWDDTQRAVIDALAARRRQSDYATVCRRYLASCM